MTDDEAKALYGTMLVAWPDAHLDRNLWLEELQLLDAGTAGTAFIRLRRETDHPSIYKFTARYRSLDTRANRDPVEGCGRCNDGAITVYRPNGSRVAYACSCPAGAGWRWLGPPPHDLTAADLEPPTPPEPTPPTPSQPELDLDPATETAP